MYRLLVVCSLALAAHAQYRGDPGTAAILAETRQLNADGSSNVAYAQEDGVLFKETVNQEGERRGAYEYTGDDGQKYRVEYVAGVGGFRIVSSTHVDSTPVQPASAPRQQQQYTPQQQYAPQPTAARPAPLPQPARPAAATNNFSFNYATNGNQQVASQPTYVPTTTTTPAPAVRRNFHTGKVSLDRNDRGFTYTYTHNGR